jgi:hypothetical protein
MNWMQIKQRIDSSHQHDILTGDEVRYQVFTTSRDLSDGADDGGKNTANQKVLDRV